MSDPRSLASRAARNRTLRYFAACTLGVEAAVVAELKDLGAGDVTSIRGGVHFEGDRALGYAAALWLRSATRVQQELARGKVSDRDELYRFAGTVDWSRYLRVDQTLAVESSIRDSFATDPRYPALVLKDAIVDQWRARAGRRPSVDRVRPTLPLKLVLKGQDLVLYRDFSNESLHKRGYRPIQVKSPLNEALAAGLLRLSGWDGRSPLLDPMCGSATFLIEGAWIASDRAPGLGRRFPFFEWPDFLAEAWNSLHEDARQRAERGLRNIPALEAADRHPGALSLARLAAQAAGVADYVLFTQTEVRDLQPDVLPSTVVVNPPYGERVGRGDDLEDSWRSLGAFLHERCAGATAFVLSGNSETTRLLGLKAGRRWPVRNGTIDCRWIEYQVRER